MALISYGARIRQLAEQDPERTAITVVTVDGSAASLTRRELDRRTEQVARLLADRGARQDAVVVVALPNSVEHFLATHGAWKLGAIVLPMRWDLPEWERDRILALTEPVVVVSDWESVPGDAALVSRADLEASAGLDDGPLPDAAPKWSRMIPSSGSTGTPKIIVTPSPARFETEPPPNPFMHLGDDIIQLVVSPLYHANGFGCNQRLLSGARLVVMEKFDAAKALDLIHDYRVNHMVAVPTMLQRMTRVEGVDPARLATLDTLFAGGASFPHETIRTWCSWIGPEHVFVQYGGSEGIGGTQTDGVLWLQKPGTVGLPNPGVELRIVDEAGEPMPAGEVGEIQFRRPGSDAQPFVYLGTPTPEPIGEGWRSYGDLGWTDADGALFIADRRVDMIVTGGANVFPAEVELALADHPEVLDVVVVGLPDPEWGQRVHAIIEPQRQDSPPDFGELRAYLKNRLAPYKVPKSFELVESMPRTAAGKINRALVAEQVAARTAAPSA